MPRSLRSPEYSIGFFFVQGAKESFELRLLNSSESDSTALRIRAHRDELISLESELKDKLEIESDGSLYKTPI